MVHWPVSSGCRRNQLFSFLVHLWASGKAQSGPIAPFEIVSGKVEGIIRASRGRAAFVRFG